VDAILAERLLKTLTEGDSPQFLAYLVIFALIWLDVKGMKGELKNINTTVLKSFAEGEKRFQKAEHDILSFQNRITILEVKIIKNIEDIKTINQRNKDDKSV